MNFNANEEFDFLDKQFRRLADARGLRYHDEKTRPMKKGEHSAFETAELMVAGCIKDYLSLRIAGSVKP